MSFNLSAGNHINSVSASDDGVNLNLKMAGNFMEGSHFGFYIDADNNPSTGYKGGVNEIVGADYLVESGGLHQYPDGAHGWEWKRVSTASTMENSSTEAQAHIPLQLLNAVGHTIKYLGSVASSDWSRNTYSQITEYQLGLNPPDTPIVIIGPSTVYIAHEGDEAVHPDGSSCRLEGWGENLHELTKRSDSVFNYAQPGAGAGSFRLSPGEPGANSLVTYGPNRDHYWGKTKEKMQSLNNGILLVQFGGNDAWRLNNKYPSRDANGNIIDYDGDGDGDAQDNVKRWEIIYGKFRDNIKFYIDEARQLNFTPVLITSPNPRIRGADGKIHNTRGGFPKVMKDLAQSEGVRVLDLNQKTLEEYNKYTDQELDEKFCNCNNRESGKKEVTHYESKGARVVSGWIKGLACENSASRLCQQFN
jgi:hypothetical protein